MTYEELIRALTERYDALAALYGRIYSTLRT